MPLAWLSSLARLIPPRSQRRGDSDCTAALRPLPVTLAASLPLLYVRIPLILHALPQPSPLFAAASLRWSGSAHRLFALLFFACLCRLLFSLGRSTRACACLLARFGSASPLSFDDMFSSALMYIPPQLCLHPRRGTQKRRANSEGQETPAPPPQTLVSIPRLMLAASWRHID